MLGTYALSAGYYDAWYVKAQKVRTVIRREFDAAFEKYDALVTPTAPTVPFKIGEKAADPFSMYLSDICTIPINIAGLPALALPGGFARELPIGLQLIGKPFSEKTILNLGHAYQQATDWHLRRPSAV
jgi:aspartyl-tRNA(Asn)/glutamyl-tRNA(Gln) amidotransferase subunit A